MSNYYRTAVYGHRGSGIGRGRPNPVVCGRKFCCKCGRWRHASDFRECWRNSRSGLSSLCTACMRLAAKARRAQRTQKEIERWREYQRLWYYVKRREAGVPERQFKNRHTVIDKKERLFLPLPPLQEALSTVNDWEALAREAGVPARTVHRLRVGESKHVRIDVADKLALALGWPLEVIYQGVASIDETALRLERAS